MRTSLLLYINLKKEITSKKNFEVMTVID